MTTTTRADFARQMGVNKGTVTRWVQTGRAVLAGDRVDVEASIARLQETSGARPDVAERHAAERGSAIPTQPAAKVGAGDTAPPMASAPAGAEGDRVGNSYQAARAVKEKYSALSAKLDYERSVGNLIPKEDVDSALRAFATHVRARLDVMPDQLSPLLGPVSDLDEIHAILSESARGILTAVADDMARAVTAVGRDAAA